jgi:valyl-tRNA synthetase
MTDHNLPKTYNFQETEAQPFVISIPPPNVTGELHLGHAMFVVDGRPDDPLPPHERHPDPVGAGQRPRRDRHPAAGREGPGERRSEPRGAWAGSVPGATWAWKEKYGGIITQQIRRLGASCDWDRERFTLDEGLSRAVREAFVRLYEKGLIYRGPRLINWSPGLENRRLRPGGGVL